MAELIEKKMMMCVCKECGGLMVIHIPGPYGSYKCRGCGRIVEKFGEDPSR